MATLRELKDNPKFGALSDEAKSIVFDKLSNEDQGFMKLSVEAQGIVRSRLLGPSREELRSTTDFETEFAQFGGEVTPAIPRTTEEEQALRVGVAGAVRPTLEGGLATAGATAGIPFGPVGVVGGGGGGFALGRQIADYFEEIIGIKAPDTLKEDIFQTVHDIGVGGTFEAVGAGGPAAVKAALAPLRKKISAAIGKSLPSISEAAKKDKAIQVLKQITKTPEDIAAQANKVAEAKRLEEVFPGVKFTLGELTDDRNLIRLQRGLTEKGSGLGELRAAQQAEAVQEAIQRKVRTVFPNKNGLDDVLSEVQKQSDELADTLTSASKARTKLVEELTPLTDKQAGGRTISGTLGAEQNVLRRKGGDLFKQVGNPEIPTGDLLSELRRVKAGFFEFGGREADFPSEVNKLISDITPPRKGVGELLTGQPSQARPISYQKLRGFQKRVGAGASKIKRSQDGKNSTSDAMDRAFSAIENDGFSLLPAVEQEKHIIARNFWKNNVGKKFGEGSVQKVLRQGKTSGSTKVGSASVAGEFFGKTSKDLDAADDLIRSVGPERAREVMRDFTAMDLTENKVVIDRLTGEVKTGGLANWVRDHKAVLKKYGLFEEYSNIEMAQRAVDSASDNLSLFNKSSASKLINGDINVAMTRAYEGQKDILGATKDLMSHMRGNKPALEGLRTSFADYLERQILDQTEGLISTPIKTARVINKIVDKFDPAIKTLYAGQPDRLKLLRDMRGVYRTLAREGELSGKAIEDAETIIDRVIFASGPKFTSSLSELNIFRKTQTWLRKLSQDQINSVLLKATFDPNYAELIQLPRLVPEEKFASALSSMLSRLGLVSFGTEVGEAEGAIAESIVDLTRPQETP
ncbi:MAG: hypothetical protein V3R78_10210 [Thermodesulfobacteriota bacterium]